MTKAERKEFTAAKNNMIAQTKRLKKAINAATPKPEWWIDKKTYFTYRPGIEARKELLMKEGLDNNQAQVAVKKELIDQGLLVA
jgi:hypothetical protein